jgi:Protein of unknown function (DUF3455)
MPRRFPCVASLAAPNQLAHREMSLAARDALVVNEQANCSRSATHGNRAASGTLGPTWQAKDGSTGVGSVVKRVIVDPTAIPSLKLSAASTAAGADGDRLAHTTFVEGINTTGGLAPAGACTAGATAEVPYTADYTFWKETN